MRRRDKRRRRKKRETKIDADLAPPFEACDWCEKFVPREDVANHNGQRWCLECRDLEANL